MRTIRGLYRTSDLLLGDAVRVHLAGGDAAPFLRSDIYRDLGGRPDVDSLPSREAYLAQLGEFAPDPLDTP